MKQDIAEYLVDSFVDFKGAIHQVVLCALSQSPRPVESDTLMVALPGATAVTLPFLSTFATFSLLLVHVIGELLMYSAPVDMESVAVFFGTRFKDVVVNVIVSVLGEYFEVANVGNVNGFVSLFHPFPVGVWRESPGTKK